MCGSRPPSPPLKKTFASATATPPPPGEWTVVKGKKKAAKASKKRPSTPLPAADQRSFELVQNEQPKLNCNEADSIVSSINRALHKGGISDARAERIHCTDSRQFLGITTPASSLQDLFMLQIPGYDAQGGPTGE